MSFYNMLFGCNSKSDLLLAVLGLRKHDVERFRDVSVQDDGKTIAIYARTGGGNREDYPQNKLCATTGFRDSQDDDFDSTYATFFFDVPESFVSDVLNLDDVLSNGMRKEFANHIALTLRRDPTPEDKEQEAYEQEANALRGMGVKANGHTFVPYSDDQMETALGLAEANGGVLRSCWGILPLTLTTSTNRARGDGSIVRVEVNYSWTIDTEYWKHCVDRFSAKYPTAMAKIAEAVDQYLTAKK